MTITTGDYNLLQGGGQLKCGLQISKTEMKTDELEVTFQIRQ